jgi:hypothetical protein
MHPAADKAARIKTRTQYRIDIQLLLCHTLLKRLTIRGSLDELLRLAVHPDNTGRTDQLHQERFGYAHFAQAVCIPD